jgi:hypothetical protein
MIVTTIQHFYPLFLKITILVFDIFIYKSYSFEYRFTTSIIFCDSCILSLNKTMSSAYIRRHKFNILSSWDLQYHIELCNEFMYLGILFYFNGKFVQTQNRFSDQGIVFTVLSLTFNIRLRKYKRIFSISGAVW